jgi:hypothetical protein
MRLGVVEAQMGDACCAAIARGMKPDSMKAKGDGLGMTPHGLKGLRWAGRVEAGRVEAGRD